MLAHSPLKRHGYCSMCENFRIHSIHQTLQKLSSYSLLRPTKGSVVDIMSMFLRKWHKKFETIQKEHLNLSRPGNEHETLFKGRVKNWWEIFPTYSKTPLLQKMPSSSQDSCKNCFWNEIIQKSVSYTRIFSQLSIKSLSLKHFYP